MTGIFEWVFGGLKNKGGRHSNDYIDPDHRETKGQAVYEEDKMDGGSISQRSYEEDKEEIYECLDCKEEYKDPDDLDYEGFCRDCQEEPEEDDEDDDDEEEIIGGLFG